MKISKTNIEREQFCPVCNTPLDPSISDFTFLCKNCAYEGSNLSIEINSERTNRLLNECEREKGLRATRIEGIATILKQLKKEIAHGKRLLEIGSGHGWFLEAAKDDYEVLGIEPDRFMATESQKRGLPVMEGYFPDCLDPKQKFDIIIFNDVIEHIPDLHGVLEACATTLNEGGCLAICLPSSKGVLFRTSRLLYRLRIRTFYERLWQLGLPSPHLHYFNPTNLGELLRNSGFDMMSHIPIKSFHRESLIERIDMADMPIGKKTKTLIFGGLYLAEPLLSKLPSDIFFVTAVKERR